MIPLHTDAGLEFVYVANGAVSWDYDGREVYVPAHHLSFTWPWQTHGGQDTRLPLVELYWILIPLTYADLPGGGPRVHSKLGLKAAESGELITLLRNSPPVIAAGRRSGRHIAQLVERHFIVGGDSGDSLFPLDRDSFSICCSVDCSVEPARGVFDRHPRHGGNQAAHVGHRTAGFPHRKGIEDDACSQAEKPRIDFSRPHREQRIA